MKNYTHITLVIDRSGSMSPVWDDVKGGFSEFIKSNKEAKGSATLSLYAFDNMIDKIHDFVNIQDVSDEISVEPRFSTSLIDALGVSINETGKSLADMKKKERPEKVLFVIQTDGWENSSSEYTRKQIAEMIETQENDYSWEFLFLGAGKEFLDQAEAVGMGHTFTAYHASNTSEAFSMAGDKVALTRCVMDSGESVGATFSYSAEEKEALLKAKEN